MDREVLHVKARRGLRYDPCHAGETPGPWTAQAMTAIPNRVGLYLGVVNLFFTLTWTVYAIFLPKLAAQAGIPKEWVLWILVMDQLVFAACDWAMGVAADRVARTLGRLGSVVALVTGASCLAFLLLPFVAPGGSPVLFLAVTVLWSATSSALRAPLLVLPGKHTPKPSQPWLASLVLLGLGLAGTLSPYLTVQLRDADPRLPFALAAIAVMAATLGLSRAERLLAAAPKREEPPAADEAKPGLPGFLAGIALLGIGFQVHSSLNAAPAFLMFAKPSDLEHLMPVFWIGFTLLMLPASRLTKRYGGVQVMALGALAGSAAAWAVMNAGGLGGLVAAQFAAGGAWGCVMMSATAAALDIGRGGREGRILGGMFSILALAAFARIALVATGLNKDPGIAAMLPWTPVAASLAAGLLLLAIARNLRAAPP